MSLLLRICDRSFSLSSQQGFRKFSPTTISRISTRFYSLEVQRFSLRQYKSQRLWFAPGNVDAFDISDVRSSSSDHEGTQDNDGGRQEKSFKSNEMMRKLKRYGISGILSYGLLNTVYYLTTFLLVWFYIAPAPGRMGYIAAVERFLKVMAMVWAGSQVTKLVRAGGALALAPFVDRGLSWFTVKLKFESQGKAFMAVVGFCFALAFILFLVVTLLWA